MRPTAAQPHASRPGAALATGAARLGRTMAGAMRPASGMGLAAHEPRLLASKVRVGWLVARRRASRASCRGSTPPPVYRWRYSGGEPERLVLAPQDLRAADPTRAKEIIDGRFAFAGKDPGPQGVSPFLVAPPSPAWHEALLGFTWLRHLRTADRATGAAAARTLVGEFVRGPVRFTPEALEPATTARRLLSLLSQAPLVLDGADRGFYKAFIRSLHWQTQYLLRAGVVGRDGMPRLACAIATAQASLCLSEAAKPRRKATRWLAEELVRQVLPDGGHITRNPQAVLELLLDLLPLRQSFAARNAAPPSELLNAIDRMMPMLRFFRHCDGALGAFNGMGYTQPHLIATLLTYDDTRGRPMQNAPHSGYQRVDAGGAVLLVDSGKLPPVGVSQEAHAGALSFEFSADNARIIVNCGAPALAARIWRQPARITAAHSTASVGNRSSAVFAAAGGIVGHSRPADPVRAACPRVERRESAAERSTLALGHDGYRRAFGLVHERRLSSRPHDRSARRSRPLRDRLAPALAWARRRSTLRFHLHPLDRAAPGRCGRRDPARPAGRPALALRRG